MNKAKRKLRGLEIAHEFLEKDDLVDVVVTFNNVNTKMPEKINNTVIAYPPEYPYIGMRGPLDEIRMGLNDYLSEFTSVTLAPVLGIEPLAIEEAPYKAISILYGPQRFKGKGTLIGILSTGIDYTNSVFINDQGESRIQAIWDQTIGNDSLYGYGSIYEKGIINEALESAHPFSVVPHKDEWGQGTMLAAIAAGYSKVPRAEYVGVAPEAELVIVKLRPASATMQSIFHGRYNPLAFSGLDVALAVQYICNVAAKMRKPISVCFPAGGNTGPHDGSEALTNILGAYAVNRGIAVILAAGDEADKKNHASGNLKQNPFQQIILTIPKGQDGFLIEIWATFGDKIEVSLVPPQAEKLPLSSISMILLNEAQTYELGVGSSVWTEGSKIDPETGCQIIRFRLTQPPEGDWTLSVRGINIINGTYHMWLPKVGMILPETIFSPANPFISIYNSSAAKSVITVGCYDKRSMSPAASSGRGPTRDDIIKPDFLVDSVNIPAPLPDNKFGYIRGTAPASAITAGVCATLYERQIYEKSDMFNTPLMKSMLIERLTRHQTISYPNPSTGYGVLDMTRFSN